MTGNGVIATLSGYLRTMLKNLDFIMVLVLAALVLPSIDCVPHAVGKELELFPGAISVQKRGNNYEKVDLAVHGSPSHRLGYGDQYRCL
jgi:hypothetical protein